MGENTKQNFISWLQDKNVKKMHPSACIACLEAVSDYAVKHNLSKIPFWDITDYKKFNAIKNAILSSRIFKFFNRSNAKNFDIAGKFYSDFLKEQAEIAEKASPAMSEDAALTQEINLADIIDKASVTEEAISSVAENETKSIVETKEPKRCVKHNKFGYGIITRTENGRHTIKFFGDSQAEREIAVNFANLHEVPESEYDAVISTLQEGGSVDEKPQPTEPANVEVESQIAEEQAESKENVEQENFDYDANLEVFKQWLYDVKKVNWRTKESFGHYLETLNDYLLSRHLTDKSLLLLDEAELASISKTLSADESFQAYDHTQHNCLSVALKFFCEYVRSGAAKFNQEKIKREEAKKASEVASKIEFLIVDFSAPADYTFANIKSVSYFGNERTDISTWKNAYQFIVSQLYEDYPDKFTLILADNYCAGVRIELSENASDMRSALCVTEGLYAEGNHSAETFVKKLTVLLDFCEVDYENVVIKYTKNSKKEETVIEADNDVVLSVDFSSIGDYTFTTVQSVSYFDKTNIKISKWRIAYKFILQELFKDYPDKIYRIINNNDAAGIRIKISRNSADMYTPITIAQGIYAEGNRSAGQIVNIIKGLLDFCNVDYENVIINYTKDKQEETAQPVPQPIIENQPVQTNSPSRELNYNDRLLDYKRWLADVKKLNENTCLSYFSSIKTIDVYLVKRNVINRSIIIMEVEQLNTALDSIFADEKYLEYNNQQHGRFSTSLKCFYEYRTGKQYSTRRATPVYARSDTEYENVPFNVTSDYDGILFSYKRWLADVKNLNDHTCNSYYSSLKTIDEYLVKRGIIEKSIVNFSNDELLPAMDMIFADGEFLAYNAQQHNRFSAALKNFYEYRTGLQYAVKSGAAAYSTPSVQREEASTRQPAWDIYEASILLDGYIKVTHGANRQNIIADVSAKLRQMAINKGKEIDSIYRNLNGISLQIFNMQQAYTGESEIIHHSKTFKEAVTLYKEDREKFNAILDDAYKMCAVKSEENSVADIEIPTVHRLKYEDRYLKVLKEQFESGFRYKKFIDKNRFGIYYSEMYSEELTEDIEDIIEFLKKHGTEIDDRLYYKDEETHNGLMEKIEETISQTFNDGASCIYIDCLFAKFSRQLADDLHIYNAETFADLLINSSNTVYFRKYGYIYTAGIIPDFKNDIREYMKNSYTPVTYDQIEKDLWFIPLDRIKYILVTTESMVMVADETYFYAQNLPISESELQAISSYINSALLQRRFIIDNELMSFVREHCPSVLVNTTEYADWGLRNAIGYLLRNEFSFNNAVISRKGEYIDMIEVFADYGRSNEKTTVEQLKNFAAELDTPIYWDTIHSQMVRINKDELVRKDKITFDIDAIDDVLSAMIAGNYAPINTITLFYQFPSVGYSWNIYLLESFVSNYSKKFRLLHTGFAATDCSGAIVRRGCGIDDLSSLFADVLSYDLSWKNSSGALQYLVDNGYLIRKSYKDINNVIVKAKAIAEARKQQI